MIDTRLQTTWKSVVSLVCAGAFLVFAQGSVTGALAADATPPATAQTPAPAQTWETWPKKPVEPAVQPPPTPAADTTAGAAAAGAAGGTKTSAGLSAGTIGWIALGVGVLIAVGVAAAGGDSSTSAPVCSQ